MLVFLYLLASLGVAYWARINQRNATWWFAVSVICTPLIASIALAIRDRYGW